MAVSGAAISSQGQGWRYQRVGVLTTEFMANGSWLN